MSICVPTSQGLRVSTRSPASRTLRWSRACAAALTWALAGKVVSQDRKLPRRLLLYLAFSVRRSACR